ncbi:hypothetical protein ACHAPT_012187 [Fusarium lateritium]
MIFLSTLALSLGSLATAQQFVPPPQGLQVLQSKLFKGAEISYKKTSICETTDGVNSYSGYVTLPKHLLPDAKDWDDDTSAHLFFWYFDQPIGTGFSYANLANGSLDVPSHTFTPMQDNKIPEVNATTFQATFDPRIPETVPKTTMSAARTLWAFAQVWFNEFPEWNTQKDEISLWTSSYGGMWGPHFFSYFQDQNELIENGTPSLENATTLNLATLGLDEPGIDFRAMAMGYPMFGHNNTYGIQIFSDEVYEKIMAQITAPDEGCYALVDRCRSLVLEGDPERFGTNETVNEACVAATNMCFGDLQGTYGALSDRSPFDLTVSNVTVLPWHYMDNYLNQAWVQQELGVPLNFTYDWGLIGQVFLGKTGDPMVGSLTTLAKVMKRGVNVAIVYGDRDYRCPWYGGENVSLTLDFHDAEGFRSAGYQSIITNSSYNGGFVREHGSLSFSRIFQAGHGVPSYQPETMFKIFERAMFSRDIATGKINLNQNRNYSTTGPMSVADVKSEVPEAMENMCFVRLPETCTDEQLAALADGTALVEDWIVVEPRGEKPRPI